MANVKFFVHCDVAEAMSDSQKLNWESSYVFFKGTSSLLGRICLTLAFSLWSFAEAWTEDTTPVNPEAVSPVLTLETKHVSLLLDAKGHIVSLKSRASGTQYVPAGRPSALLSLHEERTPGEKLLRPTAASVDKADKDKILLTYSNGSVATVKVTAQDKYFRFQLVALTNRDKVDNVIWGPLDTTIGAKIGDIIGVVRDPDFAIGMYPLDDNTIPGDATDGDCFGMGYYVHSPDPSKYPVPPKYKEGQTFNIGGDGVSDTAFFSRPEEYFQFVAGNGAKLQPEFGSTILYHSRDRRKSYVHLFSLLPGFKGSRPRHMVSDPVPDVDYLGSAVALYACPDDLGLDTIESIIKKEKLPYITTPDGRWVRDPANHRPTLHYHGPHDKAIEYAKAMGFKYISRDTGEFYSTTRPSDWTGRVGFSGGTKAYKEFGEECRKHGLAHGGLHVMCLFLQGGRSRDVTPEAHPNLQTICRVKLAKDISPTDTEIIVDESSYLGEDGTWTFRDGHNYVRIGTEIIKYQGISDAAPWKLLKVKRGVGTTATRHSAGDEVAKLMLNCYHGFVPDMKLMPKYAEYYADLMVQNGMDIINFDGYESLMYQNHGYYAMKAFNRRLFEAYNSKTDRYPLVTGSNVFAGAWEYMYACDLGGGNHMFNPLTGRRGIEGKDIIRAFTNNWFPGTFGIQGWNKSWSLYNAENLMAKSIGWDATFALSVSQAGIDATGDREAIFNAFRAWQRARELQLFSDALKTTLRDPDLKHHIEQVDNAKFRIFNIKQLQAPVALSKGSGQAEVNNPFDACPLDFELRLDGADAKVSGLVVTLPDGSTFKSDQEMVSGQCLVFKPKEAYIADNCRKKIADTQIQVKAGAKLPKGKSVFTVKSIASGNARFTLTAWARDEGVLLDKAQ